jgi:dTMP kinase
MSNAAPNEAETVKKGLFVCIEGLDGSGKSTQAKLLVEQMRKTQGAILTAEPSQGKIGTFIRNNCLYGETRLSSIVEALLFAADRVEHVQDEIAPALERGQLVVSDRYLYSSIAYQGAAGLSVEWITSINKHALRPDLAIFLDVELETVMRRLKPKKSVMENLRTQEKVRELYLELVKKGDLGRIDGNRNKGEIAQEIYSIVKGLINVRRQRI